MIDPEFIKRAEEFCKPLVEENVKREREYRRKWQADHPERFRELQNRYFATKKGKRAVKRKSKLRHIREREAVKYLSQDEIEEIKEFYRLTPIGYEVDHIHPLSKGGKHHISNLQYLTRKENLRKGSKIIDKDN